MLSYTAQRNLFGTLVNNSDTATLALADTLINQRRREVLTKRNWWFLERQFTQATALTQFVNLPGQVDRILSSPTVTVGSTRYTPIESPSWDHWNNLNLSQYTSNTPEYWIQYGQTLGLWPTPATAGNTITYNAKRKVIDLSKADFTTGTIVEIANGGTTVTGAGTSWTTGMAGSYLRITGSNTANKGDDVWYEIASVTDAQTLVLARTYGGTSLSVASANYTIGQMSILPEAYDELPIDLALQYYFTSIDPNPGKAQMYAAMATQLLRMMEADQSNRTGGRVVHWGVAEDESIINPNLIIRA